MFARVTAKNVGDVFLRHTVCLCLAPFPIYRLFHKISRRHMTVTMPIQETICAK